MMSFEQLPLALFGLGGTELLILLVIVLIIFGVGKLPQVGEALGKSIKNFKQASSDEPKDTSSPQSGDVENKTSA